MKKNFLVKSILVCSLVCACALSGCGAKDEETRGTSTQKTEATVPATESSVEADDSEVTNCTVAIEIEKYGTIKVALDYDAAPLTVKNFVKLVKSGFYDGVSFHRIMKGFMMQGGDPTGTGMGGSKDAVKGEFSQNGINNPLSHTRGAISMARSNDMDSASSQFFIVHQDSVFLDGAYACFGYVTEGMDVVDKICEEAVVIDNNGTVEVATRPIIKTITIVEE